MAPPVAGPAVAAAAAAAAAVVVVVAAGGRPVVLVVMESLQGLAAAAAAAAGHPAGPQGVRAPAGGLLTLHEALVPEARAQVAAGPPAVPPGAAGAGLRPSSCACGLGLFCQASDAPTATAVYTNNSSIPGTE